jgi:rare lipoprotein A
MSEALLVIRLLIPMVKAWIVAGMLLAWVGSASAETCIASHYGHGDGLQGSRTANGERFNTNAMTAAHRRLAFGTRVRVTHAGRTVEVRINDRGPFVRGRCIDLSWAAARALGIGGTGRVVVEALP